jgi:hypothetical protein
MYLLNDVNLIENFLNIENTFDVSIILEFSLLSQVNDNKYIQNIFCFRL